VSGEGHRRAPVRCGLRRARRAPPRVRGIAAASEGEDHRHTAPVLGVLRVDVDQIPLFELNRHQNVGRRHHGKQQVRHGHRRRSPERQQPSEIQRVPDEAVGSRCDEVQLRILAAAQVQPHLTKAEEIEVVDQECGDQHQDPSRREDGEGHRTPRRALDAPHDAAERAPLPEEQDKRQAAGEHIRAALRGLRNQPQKPTLEPRTCHHAVLHREQRQQPEVDRQRRQKRRRGARVERLRDNQVADEPDGVKKGRKERAVGGDAIDEYEYSAHHFLQN
jgi:hypothetical protein